MDEGEQLPKLQPTKHNLKTIKLKLINAALKLFLHELHPYIRLNKEIYSSAIAVTKALNIKIIKGSLIGRKIHI